MNPRVKDFEAIVRNPWKLRMFLISSLPMAWLAGLRVVELTDTECRVQFGYKYWVKNPFKSVYFAVLAMAAELSTGVMAMREIYKRKPGVSMLVVGLEAEFLKKASGKITFTCPCGESFREKVQLAVDSGMPQTVCCHSIGTDKSGEEVAKFKLMWSFKARSASSS
ncbi:MAG: DUF4442 domain-containing protein [Flavobacteriales bacterium]|nr:DUF4442 domain-containing protein [Flavobacteriales bacterium]